MNKGR